MGNVKNLENPQNELYTFDLKGSKDQRETKHFDPKKALYFLKTLQNVFIGEETKELIKKAEN